LASDWFIGCLRIAAVPHDEHQHSDLALSEKVCKSEIRGDKTEHAT